MHRLTEKEGKAGPVVCGPPDLGVDVAHAGNDEADDLSLVQGFFAEQLATLVAEVRDENTEAAAVIAPRHTGEVHTTPR
ncbi:hypothetical protein ACUXST_002094 [Sphingomonas sp. F9_3S_D5_B_2]